MLVQRMLQRYLLGQCKHEGLNKITNGLSAVETIKHPHHGETMKEGANKGDGNRGLLYTRIEQFVAGSGARAHWVLFIVQSRCHSYL